MLGVRRLLLGWGLAALAVAPATAQSIYPLNRAEILLGSKFDFKVELEGKVAAAAIKVTFNGRDAARCLVSRRRSRSTRRGLATRPIGYAMFF